MIQGQAGVDLSKAGTPAPDVEFVTPDGETVRISDFEGRPVLLNLWASWCAPCIKELPTLGALAEANRQGGLAVVPVSQDMGSKTSVDAFLKSKGIGEFAAYHDPKMGLTSALGIEVMPTTVLYDAQGREVWRYIGDLDWTGEEAAKLLEQAYPKQ